jgi:hypothetical protein
MVLAAIGCVGTAQAAEKIRYEEIPLRVVAHSSGATVFTTDGMSHAGARLVLEPDQAVLYQKDGSVENIPVDRIARVAIKHERTHFFEFTKASASAIVFLPYLVCGGDLVCTALATAAFSPATIAVTAGSAPVTLVLDGAAFFISPKVYEIVH